MGSKDHVASPTFTISREYNATDLTMYHFDFYRLQEPGIVAAELQEFVNDPKAVVVIEWGAIVADVLPDDKIIIELVRRTETSRTIKISCTQKLKYICKDLA